MTKGELLEEPARPSASGAPGALVSAGQPATPGPATTAEAGPRMAGAGQSDATQVDSGGTRSGPTDAVGAALGEACSGPGEAGEADPGKAPSGHAGAGPADMVGTDWGEAGASGAGAEEADPAHVGLSEAGPAEADPDRPALVEAETCAWLDRAVIGLDLCPFAKSARARGRTRIVVSPARDVETLLEEFAAEVQRLLGTSPRDLETTLLVHPSVLADFADYNDFLDLADAALEALGATGVLQVASFHPGYQFAGTAADDITNATNRSPYPLLQLLREDSVAAALDSLADPDAIYEANIARLRSLGAAGWQELQRACRREALDVVRSKREPPGTER